MPSKKPRIQALVNEATYEKFKILCEIEDRSESNFGGKIIADYINEYEKEHGHFFYENNKKEFYEHDTKKE